MITLQADFNHLDPQGRLRLGDLRMHQETPFAQIAARNESILFVDGGDLPRPRLGQRMLANFGIRHRQAGQCGNILPAEATLLDDAGTTQTDRTSELD